MIPANVRWRRGRPRLTKPIYTVSFRIPGSGLQNRWEFAAADDATAKVMAAALHAPAVESGYELRQGERIVMAVMRSLQ
ncbi:MAG: hypothetical protein ACXWNN_12790 [Candidatus Binataceae bacterium]